MSSRILFGNFYFFNFLSLKNSRVFSISDEPLAPNFDHFPRQIFLPENFENGAIHNLLTLYRRKIAYCYFKGQILENEPAA